jgi:hypothetical protein
MNGASDEKKWLPVCVSLTCAFTGNMLNGFTSIQDNFLEKVLVKHVLLESMGSPVPVSEPTVTFGPHQRSKSDADAYNLKLAAKQAAAINAANTARKRSAVPPKKKVKGKKKKKKTSSSFLKKNSGGDWVTLGNGKRMKMKKKK